MLPENEMSISINSHYGTMKKITNLACFLTLLHCLMASAQVQIPPINWVRGATIPNGSPVGYTEEVPSAVDDVGNAYVAYTYRNSITLSDTIISGGVDVDFCLAKFDKSGNRIWVQNFSSPGNSLVTDIAISKTGNIYLSGNFEQSLQMGTDVLSSRGSTDIFFAKMRPNGSIVWARRAGGSSTGPNVGDGCGDIGFDSRGNLVATGIFFGSSDFGPFTLNSLGHDDMWLAKYDTNGNAIWATSAGGPIDCSASWLAIDNSDNVYVSGQIWGINYFGSSTITSNGWSNYIAKFNNSGTPLWAKVYYTTGWSFGGPLAIDSLNNCIASMRFQGQIDSDGFILNSAGGGDCCLFKLNPSGNIIWLRSIAATDNNDMLLSLCIDKRGRVLCSGVFSGSSNNLPTPITSNGLSDVFIGRCDLEGNILDFKTIGGSGNEYYPNINSDMAGNLLMTLITPGGFSLGSATIPATSLNYPYIFKFGNNTVSPQSCNIIPDFIADTACEGSATVFRNLSPNDTSFQYTIRFGDGQTSSINTQATHIYGAYGTYQAQLIVTSRANCKDSVIKTVVVRRKPATPTIAAGGPTTFCQGGSVTLTSSASEGYIWSNGATTRNITVSTPGSYSVRTISSTCTSAVSQAVTVSVIKVDLGRDTSVCAGAPVTLAAKVLGLSGGTGSILPANLQTGLVGYWPFNGNANDASGNGNNGTVYGATLTTDRNGVPNSAYSFDGISNYIGINNSILPVTSSSSTVSVWFLTSDNDAHLILDRSGPGNTKKIGITINVDPQGNTVVSAGGENANCAGPCACFSSNTSPLPSVWNHVVLVNDLLANTSKIFLNGQLVATRNSFCYTNFSTPTSIGRGNSFYNTNGDAHVNGKIDDVGIWSRALTASEVLQLYSGTTYLWSTGATTPNIQVNPTQTTSYWCTATTNGQSCTDTVKVSIGSPAAPTIAAAGPTTFCQGGSVTLTAPAGFGYLWSNGATTRNITVNSPGNYTVRTIANACTSAVSTPTVVSVTAPPATPTIAAGGPTTFCQGGSVTLTATSTGLGYIWNTGATTRSITVSTPGSYSVRTIANACTSAVSTPTVVSVTAPPSTPTIAASGPTTFCQGDSVILTASSTGFGFIWSTGATSSRITVSTAGSYTVRTISNVCTSAVSAVTVVGVTPAPAAPTITALSSTTICEVGSTLLRANGGSAYIWNTGETNNTINAASAGIYTVRAIASACTSAVSSPITITQYPSSSRPEQDCIGAIRILNSQTVIPDRSLCGRGNVQDNYGGGCGVSESTTAFFQFGIQRPGELRFVIVPNDLDGGPSAWRNCSDLATACSSITDYDWVLYRLPTGSSSASVSTCSLINVAGSFTAPNPYDVGCDYSGISGVTGMYDSLGAFSSFGIPNNKFRIPITVNTGDFFILAVNNFRGSPKGFNLFFIGPEVATVSSLARHAQPPSLELSPNPTSNSVHLKLTHGEIEHVEVIDQLGRSLLSLPRPARNTINLQGLPASTYILKVRYPGGVLQRQVVKQ